MYTQQSVTSRFLGFKFDGIYPATCSLVKGHLYGIPCDDSRR
jgi:hypothetical protein